MKINIKSNFQCVSYIKELPSQFLIRDSKMNIVAVYYETTPNELVEQDKRLFVVVDTDGEITYIALSNKDKYNDVFIDDSVIEPVNNIKITNIDIEK